MVPDSFFKEELSRPFDYYEGIFDCGCVQSDGITVNIEQTLDRYMNIAKRNKTLLEQEVQWCRVHKVDGIVSDIVPFAFEVAVKAGIPSVGVSNFSWADIYMQYLDYLPSFQPFLAKIKTQYAMADLLLALTPSNDMKDFKRRVSVPLVAKKGNNRIDEIKAHFEIDKSKRVGLVYTGNFGMNSMTWQKLERFKEWEFIGLYPLPGSPLNYHIIDKADFPYKDISASVDLLISKIGYGVFSECLANGIPLVYTPRTNFSEHSVLEKTIKDWGHGYTLSYDDYYNLNWEKALKSIIKRDKPEKIKADGGFLCAEKIEQFISSKRN